MKRGTKGLKPASKKRAHDDRTRAVLRQQFLALKQYCEMCGTPATDVDEIISRGVMPGAQMNPDLFQALCRACHRIKTDNPDWAYRHGWSAHEWDLKSINSIKDQRVVCPLDCPLNHIEEQ